MQNTILKEQRCECGKLLFKGIFLQANLEIKCKRCGKINQIGVIKDQENNDSYLLVVDEFGAITHADDNAYQILGYIHDELVGKHFALIDKDLPKSIATRLMPPNSILSYDDYFQIDTFNYTKDNKKLAVTVLLKLYKPTEKERYVLAFVNLRKEKDLFTEAKFRDNICDFYFEVDKQGRGKYLSPEVESIFGISSEMGIGKSYFDFVAETKRAEAQARFNYFVSREEAYRVLDNCGLDVKGNFTHTELFFTPIFNQDAKFVGYRVLGWLKK